MVNRVKQLIKKRFYTFLLLLIPLIWFLLPPSELFTCDYSRAVLSRDGELLRVWLTEDEQFRFPPSNTPLPEKYITAVTTYEDQRYYSHLGVDLLSIGRATIANIKAGSVVEGGSTITMQLARLSNPADRTVVSKISEAFRAVRISLHYSKDEVLKLYSAHLPMGGNIVGLESASFRYYGKPPVELSWAEAALFAVLPNAPGMIDISRKREALLQKRNGLLEQLHAKDLLSDIDFALAVDEPLPEKVNRIPFEAPHFSRFLLNSCDETLIHSTLDRYTQQTLEDAIERYQFQLNGVGVENSAVMIADVKSAEVLAYAGSQNFFATEQHGMVDGVQARRSTGSLLKPILTAALIDRGPFTPQTMLQDIPTYYGTFAPQNANHVFGGVVSLHDALTQSLNVPFVRLLNYYGNREFYDLIERGGVDLPKSANHYGLSLVIGGAEASLWDMMNLYLPLSGDGSVRRLSPTKDDSTVIHDTLFSAGSAALTRDIMTNLIRPGFEQYRSSFANGDGKIAWKTGTSYGHKDGWAVGFSGEYLIGVWVGNFSGEGNPAIGGAKLAAPLLFSLFGSLRSPDDSLPELPLNNLDYFPVCAGSGYPAGDNCDSITNLLLPISRTNRTTCPYHRVITVDKTTGEQLCSACWSGKNAESDTVLIYPPAARQLYHNRGYDVDTLPVHNPHCNAEKSAHAIELVYPTDGITIFLPRNFDTTREKLIFNAIHRRDSAELFWYLDQNFIGTTSGENKLTVDSIAIGEHTLFVQDSEGSRAGVKFSVFWQE